jgi:hypothetical protein
MSCGQYFQCTSKFFCQVFDVNILLLFYLRASNFMCIITAMHHITQQIDTKF